MSDLTGNRDLKEDKKNKNWNVLTRRHKDCCSLSEPDRGRWINESSGAGGPDETEAEIWIVQMARTAYDPGLSGHAGEAQF